MKGRWTKGLLILAVIALAGGAAVGYIGDEKKWAEAMATWARCSGSKDAQERARAVEELGNATYDKKDKQCFGYVQAMLVNELNRGDARSAKDEEKISNDVLEACVAALKKITSAEAVESMIKVARNKNENPRVRIYVVWGLGGISNTNSEKLLTELVEDKQPSVQIAAVDAIVERGKKEDLPVLMKVLKGDHTWEAKIGALKGVEKFGDDTIVDALIDVLEKAKPDEGRVKFELNKILAKLVGKDLNTESAQAWRDAWAAKKKGQDPGGNAGPGGTQVEPTEFFGLKSKSTRIVFVLDRTGSMAAALNVKEEPKKDPPPKKGPDTATGVKETDAEKAQREDAAGIKKKYDERKVATRMDALKKEFINTIYNLDPKVHFTVIWYEANQQPWKEQLVPATWANKLEIIRETDKLNPSGGTNIWGAIEMAYKLVEQPARPDVVQVDKKGNYATIINGADTFFLMTDGAHNTGKFVKQGATSSDACDTQAFMAELRKVNKLRKVIINTVCLGSEPNGTDRPDPTLMKAIADETGGEFVHIKG